MSASLNDKTLAKYSERQQNFLRTGVGRKFYGEYLCRKGNHTYVIGNTGAGKTQRNFWLLDFLKRSENVVWISTGKTDEILPLLFMDCKVRIIVPTDADFEIIGIENAPIEPEVIRVSSPGEVWWNVLKPSYPDGHNREYNKITIFEFRNTLMPNIRSGWMAELFSELAEWSREGTMPKIFPCSIFVDESQWVLAGTRITTDQGRTKSAEIVTENALEIRSKGGRLIFSAQDYKNVTPASRENMLNAIMCRGAKVSTEENRAWTRACGDSRTGVLDTSKFRRNQGRFVFDDGDFFPLRAPWEFPLFPEKEEDREKLYNMTVRYGRKFAGKTEKQEEQEELCPELGRFSALAIPPEKQEALKMSRFDAGVLTDES
jgi:hypothetical protein